MCNIYKHKNITFDNIIHDCVSENREPWRASGCLVTAMLKKPGLCL